MKTAWFVLIVAGAIVAAVAGRDFWGQMIDESPPDLQSAARLPLDETRGVLGETDVVSTDPADPFQSMVSSSKSSITAIPASLTADGITDTTVVVTVRTAQGSLVAGAQVNLESSRGQQDTIEVVRGITGPDGQAIFMVRSLSPGTLILTASVGTRILDQRAVVKFTDPPVTPATVNARIIWIGLGAIILIIFFQYLFARTVLAARRREEQELFFYHYPPSDESSDGGPRILGEGGHEKQLGRQGVTK